MKSEAMPARLSFASIVGLMAAVLSTTSAPAAPIILACKGMTNLPGGNAAEDLSVTIDFTARTAMVGNSAAGWTAPVVSSPNDDVVTLKPNPEARDGVRVGAINRITGEAHIVYVQLGQLSMFDGICKPAQRQF